MKLEAALSPTEVLTKVAQALPADVRANVIIIGSLAAGYHFFAGDGARAIRTKGRGLPVFSALEGGGCGD